MSEEEKPDFSFLDEMKNSSDSAILDNKNSGDKDDLVPESETSPEPQAESQPAWMDEAEKLEDRYDSSTRFAAALESSEDAASKSGSLFNFSDEQQPEEKEKAEDLQTGDERAETEQETESAKVECDTEPGEQAPVGEETETRFPASEETAPVGSKDRDVEQQLESSEVDTGAANRETACEETATNSESEDNLKLSEQKESPGQQSAVVTGAGSPAPTRTASSAVQGPVVSRRLFIIVLSYASAITLICAILIMQSFQAKKHDLESLPDLKPPMKDDEIAYRLVPEAAKLPPGHTLKLGESRRFGNVRVTPTKVVYEPLEFTHYSPTSDKTRVASKPVMKLWLKFENVSKDQKFAPLDRKLMLMRIVDPKRREYMRSNQFLCPADSKGDLDKTSLLYNLEMVGDWDFAGVKDDPVLSPGETLDIYLPSSEEAYDKMDGEITWRVQFRKGYNPKSKRGVTTLIEVIFDKKQVISA